MIGWSYREAEAARKSCKHTSVMPDPITGDWVCARCFKDFLQIPEVDVELPRGATLWERIKWAFRPRKKVAAVPFVWTVAWGRLRNREDNLPPVEPRNWRTPKIRRTYTAAELDKVYDHPASKNAPKDRP